MVAALIKHCGCVSLCIAEDEALLNDTKIKSERPYQLLIDIWRSAQRCIEHAIRSKKERSFDTVTTILGKKAELLLDLKVNKMSLNIHNSLLITTNEIQKHTQQLLLCPQLINNDKDKTEISYEILEDSNKQLNDVTEFLMSSMSDVKKIKSNLFKLSFHTVVRTAGLKSFSLLFNKIEENDAAHKLYGKLPGLSGIGMQPAAIEYLFLAFRELSDEIPSETSLPQNQNTVIPISTSQIISNPTTNTSKEIISSGGLSGHYSDGLHGVNSDLMDDLKNSFQIIFEFITQLLSRFEISLDQIIVMNDMFDSFDLFCFDLI